MSNLLPLSFGGKMVAMYLTADRPNTPSGGATDMKVAPQARFTGAWGMYPLRSRLAPRPAVDQPKLGLVMHTNYIAL